MGENGQVVRVKDTFVRWLLSLITLLCGFGAKQIWEHNQLITTHTAQIAAINEKEKNLEGNINMRLERIERRQDDLLREVLKK
jgi:hypothetical protein